MEINVKNMGNCVRFEITGIIDKEGAEVLKNSLRELDLNNVKELILDFRKVKYICSSGVSKLLMFYKEMATSGGNFRIEDDTRIFHELLSITNMEAVVSVYYD